jgi:hypothetical protein
MFAAALCAAVMKNTTTLINCDRTNHEAADKRLSAADLRLSAAS